MFWESFYLSKHIRSHSLLSSIFSDLIYNRYISYKKNFLITRIENKYKNIFLLFVEEYEQDPKLWKLYDDVLGKLDLLNPSFDLNKFLSSLQLTIEEKNNGLKLNVEYEFCQKSIEIQLNEEWIAFDKRWLKSIMLASLFGEMGRNIKRKVPKKSSSNIDRLFRIFPKKIEEIFNGGEIDWNYLNAHEDKIKIRDFFNNGIYVTESSLTQEEKLLRPLYSEKNVKIFSVPESLWIPVLMSYCVTYDCATTFTKYLCYMYAINSVFHVIDYWRS